MSTLDRLRSGELAASSRLDLRGLGLDRWPQEIFQLADSLEVLDLSNNSLSSLPDDLGRLRRLKVLFCSDNHFTELPVGLGECQALEMIGFKSNRIRQVDGDALPPRLRWLILTGNQIEALPRELGQRPYLQKLMLAGNRLRELPDSLAGCERLELLRLAANRFERLPSWLADHPSLSWLALAGNPWDDDVQQAARAAPVDDIDWHELELGTRLGEGASGVIHRAEWSAQGRPARAVAVKLFKGQLTSDGWPSSEMNACMRAGSHAARVSVLGRVRGHPQGEQGLVLERVDSSFRNLAAPPSFESCTRDVYAPGVLWTAPVALRMARGLASAMTQLHARGILHGDLYAHNILFKDDGGALLGDFGAATLLRPDDEAMAGAMERIEVRAFGVLLSELCERVEGDAPARMASLAVRCMAPPPSMRPRFAEIEDELAAA